MPAPLVKINKTDVIVPTTQGNPRRPNTHGFWSFNLFSEAEGVTVERFQELGGRMTDLRWELAHGHIKLVAA